MTETKVCTKCGEEKPLTEFHKSRKSHDGLGYWCKSCKKEFRKRFYEENRGRLLEYRRRYYEDHREQSLDHAREYHEMNREQLLGGMRRYARCVKKPACPAVGGRGAEFVTFTCEACGTEFRRLKSAVDSDYERRGALPRFCSHECYWASMRKDYKSPYARNIERIKKEVGA